MTTISSPNSIIAIDEYLEGGWSTITVVTQTQVLAARLKANKQYPILKALHSGADPEQTLKAAAPLGHPPGIVSLGTLEAMEWHADEDFLDLRLRYFDETKCKSRCVRATFRDVDSRQKIIDAVKQVVDDFDEVEMPASIWHTGVTPLSVSATVSFFFGGLATVGYMFPNAANADRSVSRRGKAIANLLNDVGPTGVLLIGAAVVAAMMLWWYIECRNPVVKTVTTPRRNAI